MGWTEDVRGQQQIVSSVHSFDQLERF